MKITVRRIFKGDTYTIGKLYIDGDYFCDTIEDVVRILPSACPYTPKGIQCKCQDKIHSETAIPAGIYNITLEYSPRFKSILPYLHNVPHFLGILIHSGNDQTHSEGCIIVGRNKVRGKVLESKVTLNALLKRVGNEKNLTIEII